MDNSKSQTLDFVDGYNALMIKAEEGDLREVQKLLADLKQPDVNAMNRNNTTALSLAAKNGHYRIVETLLSNGADPNIRNTSGQSPLFLACWNNFQDIVRLLIDNRAEVNTRDQRGWTPLMIAAFNGHKEIVRLLIERNADTTIQDCFGKSAADRTKDPQILKLLQNSNKIARNYTDGGEGQKSGIFLINPSPNKVYTIEQMSALLKKASPLKETQESRGAHSYSATKTPSGNLKKSFTLGPNPPQFSNEKIAGSIDKSEYYTPQNRREPIGFRKNSDTKVATRFNRIREERSATSAEKSYRLASRSPIRSALVTSRTKESPNRSRIIRGATSRSTVTSSYNEVKKQALKEDIEKDLIGQVEHVSDKVQGLVFQKISLEVPKRMQSFERDLKKELNSLFQFRVDNMFKSLHASFNLKVKFCLNKLGYDTAHLDLTPFEESDPAVVNQEHKLFLEQLPHYDYGKEELAIEKDLHKLERSLSRGLLETDQSLLTSFVNTRESATHISFVNKSELVSNLYEQLGQEVRQSTEYLMEFSNGKINDVMREETNRIYQGMIAALNRNMDYVEEDFKNNFDSIVTQKINELLGSLGKPPASAGSSAGDKGISPEITPSKPLLSSFPKTTVDKRITFSQEFGSGIRDDKSVLSSVELTSSIMRGPDIQSGMQMNTSGYKETDFSQTKSKIQRLKNSLNFIDEEKQQALEIQEERPRERGTGSSQLEKNVLIQDNTQSTVSGDEQKRPASFMDSIKKEYYENIQAAAKLDELKSYYQKKNDQGSVSYGRDQGVAQNTRLGQAGEKRPPFK